MTKVLSKVAPIAGAAIGFGLGGPSGAALGLGLGGAAGGAIDSLNPPSQSSGGINPAAYQPLTPDQLNQYLGLLYPAATTPAGAGGGTEDFGGVPFLRSDGTYDPGQEWRVMAGAPSTAAPVAGSTPLSSGIGGSTPRPPLSPNYQQFPALADAFAQDRMEVEQSGLGNLTAEQAAARAQQIGAQISAAGGVPDPNLANQYRIALNAATQKAQGSGQQGGLGGAPSIAVPQINGGTPAFNIAGGALSKTNTVVQNEFARRFPEQLAALDELRAQVAPNVSLARQAALGQVRDQARQAQGNLRQQISRRGLAGSSFAQSAEGQLSAEYAKQAAQVEVQAAQQELDLTTKFIDMQRGLMAEALSRDLTELQVGADLAIAGGRLAADIANIQATLAAAELQARTQLNVANIGAEASRFASTSGVISQGIASTASMTNAELAARGGIIQAGLGANTSALGYQTQANIAANDLASREAAGRGQFFGNLAGLGLQTFFNNSMGNTGGFINAGQTSGFGVPNFNFGQLGFG